MIEINDDTMDFKDLYVGLFVGSLSLNDFYFISKVIQQSCCFPFKHEKDSTPGGPKMRLRS